MTFDYSSETPAPLYTSPSYLLSCVRHRSGQVKLFNFRARLFDLRQNAEAIPQHRPKQHVVCLHHFARPMKLERHLDGRDRRESSAKGDVAFLPADAPTMLRLGKDDRNQLFRHYGRLVLEGLRPKVVVMENVPGLLSLDHGQFVKDIYRLFESAGYRMQHMVLCAAHYGVPQERWRLFFIGTILDREISFPEPTHYASVRANFTGGRRLTWLASWRIDSPTA